MKTEETKNDKFTRIAESRINAILEQFRKLGNLSNMRNYDYTDEQVAKMFNEISRALKKTKQLFEKDKRFSVSKFKF